MLDFFKSLFNPAPPSSTTAKERLRLVLLSDHLSLAPDVIASLKRDLLEVISRYVEIDPAHADVTFEQRESEVAMLANIPITGVRERKRPTATQAAPEPARSATPPVATSGASSAVAEAERPPDEAASPRVLAEAIAAESHAQNASASTIAKPPRRRRRRKKASPSSGHAPATGKLATGSA